MSFYKAKVRLEGESNRNWELYFEDGRVEKFYSIDGSAQREGDDEFVFNYDYKLAEQLDNLSYMVLAPLENQILEYTVSFKNGLETLVVTKNEFI